MVSNLIVTQDGAVVTGTLDIQQLAMLAALFVPLLVNLLTKLHASDAVKAIVNIVASAIVSTLAIWINPSGQPVTVWLVVNTFIAAVAASFIAYKAVWKPVGVSGALAAKTANIGVGASEPPRHAAPDVVDVPEIDPNEDIGEMTDLDGDGIPDDLDVGNLDELVNGTSTEAVEVK